MALSATKILTSKIALDLFSKFSEKGALVILLIVMQIPHGFITYKIYERLVSQEEKHETLNLYVRDRMHPALERNTVALERNTVALEKVARYE